MSISPNPGNIRSSMRPYSSWPHWRSSGAKYGASSWTNSRKGGGHDDPRPQRRGFIPQIRGELPPQTRGLWRDSMQETRPGKKPSIQIQPGSDRQVAHDSTRLQRSTEGLMVNLIDTKREAQRLWEGRMDRFTTHTLTPTHRRNLDERKCDRCGEPVDHEDGNKTPRGDFVCFGCQQDMDKDELNSLLLGDLDDDYGRARDK